MEISSISLEERQRIFEKAMKKKMDQMIQNQTENQLYEIKKYAVCTFYRRLSSERKIQLMSRLITETDLPSLIRIVRQLAHMMKMSSYSLVQGGTGFLFDKVLLDHDRSLEESTLTENFESCVLWFRTLNSEKKFQLTFDLLLSSSGSVLDRILMPSLRVHNCHLGSFPRKVEGKARPVLREIVYETEADKARPECVEVERLRRKWHEAISKYRSEVQKAAFDCYNRTKNNAVDMIQFLPVWIVKKIFRYLDKKTVEVAKHVNNYWLETIRDLQEELKTREFLKKKLNIMKDTIDTVKLKAAEREMEEKSLKRKRRLHFGTGAIARSLQCEIPKRNYEESMQTKVLNKIYSSPDGELEIFPRYICKHDKLDKYSPSSLQDIDVEIGGDSDKQSSFLSYPCSVGSLSQGGLVSEALRAEW